MEQFRLYSSMTWTWRKRKDVFSILIEPRDSNINASKHDSWWKPSYCLGGWYIAESKFIPLVAWYSGGAGEWGGEGVASDLIQASQSWSRKLPSIKKTPIDEQWGSGSYRKQPSKRHDHFCCNEDGACDIYQKSWRHNVWVLWLDKTHIKATQTALFVGLTSFW